MGARIPSLFSILRLSLLVALCVTVSCAQNSTSSPGVLGINKSGTYLLTQINCFDPSNLTTVTDTGTISGVTQTMVVTGNSYTETLSDSDCSITIQGRIQLNSDQTYTKSKTNITFPDLGCTINYIISGSGISPTSLAEAYVAANAVSESGYWLSISDNLGFLDNPSSPKFQLTGKVCYATYVKQ